MIRRKSMPAGPERQRKQTILPSTGSQDDFMDSLRRGSLDISISPVVSLKKRVPRFRRASKFFTAMHFVRKFSSLGHDINNVEIVTPFAQILTKLNSIKRYLENNTLKRFADSDNKDEIGRHMIAEEEIQPLSLTELRMSLEINKSRQIGDNNDVKTESFKAFDDIVWCLEQLKGMQTHCSVSEMTINEFRKVLYEKQMSSESDVTNQVFEFLKTYDDSSNDRSNSISTNNSRSQSTTSEPEKRRSSSAITINSVEIVVSQAEETNGDTFEEGETQKSESRNNEFATLLRFNILKPELMTEELTSLLQTQDNWGMDIFRLSELTNERPLMVLACTIFQSRDLLGLLGINERIFIKFFTALERSYRSDVSYHNYRHGADVMQSTHVLLNSTTLKNVFSPLEVLSALFAAAIHDVDHPGVTNQYLVNTGSELALMYNDISVLENHHLSTAFKLLKQDGCNIFEKLNKEDWQKLRKLTIDIVLATDMSKHMTLLANMKTMIETQMVNTTDSGHLYLDNYSSKSLVLQNMIHCADLSNPTKPLALYRRWTNNILDEFFQQGDKEREQGLSISPNCDRNKVSVNESQIGFIDFIIRPVWETWADLVHPDVQEMLDILEENRQWHESDSNAVRRFSKVSSGSTFSDLKEENEM